MGDIEEPRRENRRRIVPSSHDVPRPRYESFMTDTLRHALTADGWNQSDSAVYRKTFVSSWLGAREYSLTVAPFDTILGGIEVSMFAMVGRMSAGETADAFGGMGLLNTWSTDVLGEYGVVRSGFGGEHPNVLGQQLADDLALWMAIRSGSDDPASMPGDPAYAAAKSRLLRGCASAISHEATGWCGCEWNDNEWSEHGDFWDVDRSLFDDLWQSADWCPRPGGYRNFAHRLCGSVPWGASALELMRDCRGRCQSHWRRMLYLNDKRNNSKLIDRWMRFVADNSPSSGRREGVEAIMMETLTAWTLVMCAPERLPQSREHLNDALNMMSRADGRLSDTMPWGVLGKLLWLSDYPGFRRMVRTQSR